ncbi:hypothetical protein BN1708_014044 [Verticillium longisporum]|uniref:Uncharacterized protein n=1 Tax=Verticillium longisporum TaxID=100787 RepID=A0A0G4LS65_VERLO|nr:hypothetical protein BN1708_014044 [Verticillium longisporum]
MTRFPVRIAVALQRNLTATQPAIRLYSISSPLDARARRAQSRIDWADTGVLMTCENGTDILHASRRASQLVRGELPIDGCKTYAKLYGSRFIVKLVTGLMCGRIGTALAVIRGT